MSDGSGGAPQLDERVEMAANKVLALAGTLDTETGLFGRDEPTQLGEYARRCDHAAASLRAISQDLRDALAASPGAGELDLTTKEETMDSMPLTYVYLAQVQAASKALSRAMEAMSDQHQDGAAAAKEVATARRCIENVYKLYADGVTS